MCDQEVLQEKQMSEEDLEESFAEAAIFKEIASELLWDIFIGYYGNIEERVEETRKLLRLKFNDWKGDL